MSFLLFNKVLRYAKNNGLLATLFQIKARLLGGHNPLTRQLNSVNEFYKDFFAKDYGSVDVVNKPSAKTINWFVPPVGKGSGGHLNIFRFIKNIEELGYRSNIVIVGGHSHLSSNLVKRNIEKWFFPLNAEVFIGIDNIPSSYFAMATSWPTAYFVRRFQGCIRKCYFVQDFEPWFYASGTESVLAENTYRFGFYGITAGGWLAKKLHDDYGMKTSAVGFSYDKQLYRPIASSKKLDGFKRVFFYARPPTPRRGFELGLLVLAKLCQELSNVQVVFAGWDLTGYDIPFPHKDAGLVSLNKLAELYCECDVALVLSFSNLSLLPLELMACGVPVVSNKAPYTTWLLNDENSILAEPNIESLALAILKVLTNENEAQRLKDSGERFSKLTSWESEARRFSNILDSLAQELN